MCLLLLLLLLVVLLLVLCRANGGFSHLVFGAAAVAVSGVQTAEDGCLADKELQRKAEGGGSIGR